MPQQVGPQKSGGKNNKDKNITNCLCGSNFQIKFADILSNSNKIQETDKPSGNGIAEITVAIKNLQICSNMIWNCDQVFSSVTKRTKDCSPPSGTISLKFTDGNVLHMMVFNYFCLDHAGENTQKLND